MQKLIFILATLFALSTQAFNDGVYRLRPADLPQAGGTGFLIEHNGEKFLLSNRHVCEITESRAFIVDHSGKQFGAIVEYLSPTDDLCLLRPSKDIVGTPSKVADYDIAPGSLIHTDGYPGLRNQTRSIGILQSYEVQISGYVPNTFTVMGKTTFRAIPGMSGSPVFDVRGQVVGVVARLSLLDTHSMLYVTGSRVRNFLRAASIVASLEKRVRIAALTASLKYGIEYDLLLALIDVESNFNPLAIGRDGEIGAFQLHPKYHSPRLLDVEHNAEEATKFLRMLKDKLEPIYGEAWFVGYNYGPNNVLRAPEKTEYFKRINSRRKK